MRLRSIVLCLGLTVAGCSHVPQPHSPERVARESQEEPPDATAIAALDALSLDGEQRTKIVALRERLRAQAATTEQPRARFIDAMIAELKAGRVDRARIDPVAKELVSSLEAVRPALLDALNELHDILTAEQRAALVDGIAERRKNQQGDAKAQMKRMSEQLDLGFGQKLSIGSALKDRLGDRKEVTDQLSEDMKAAAEAFKQAEFDAHKLAANQHLNLADWLDAFVTFAEVVVGELEPIQHATLAAIIEQRLKRDNSDRPAPTKNDSEKAPTAERAGDNSPALPETDSSKPPAPAQSESGNTPAPTETDATTP